MILSKLSLKNCGPFEDTTFQFSPGFNAIFGKNEAGKSTTSQSIPDFLFGRVEKDTYSLIHSTEQLEIEAEINTKGTSYLFVQKNNTFLQKSITRGDDKLFNSRKAFNAEFIPSGVDKDFFESAFRLNADELKKSRELFSRSTDKINSVLFNVMGNETFSSLPDVLKSEAELLYSPSGNAKKRAINKLMIEIDELKEDIRIHSLSAEEYTVQSKTINRLREEKHKKKSELRDLENKKDKTFSKLQSNADNYFNYIKLKDEIEKMGSSLSFTAQEIESIENLFEGLSEDRIEITSLKERIASAEHSLKNIHVNTEILKQSGRIKALNERKNLYISNKQKRRELEEVVRTSDEEIKKKVTTLNLLSTEEDISREELENIAKSNNIQVELHKLLKKVDQKLYSNVPLEVNEEVATELVEKAAKLKIQLDLAKNNIEEMLIQAKDKQREIDNILVDIDKDKLSEIRNDRNHRWDVLVKGLKNVSSDEDLLVASFISAESTLDKSVDNMLDNAKKVGQRSALQTELSKIEMNIEKETRAYHVAKETFPELKNQWVSFCKNDLHTLSLPPHKFEEWNTIRKNILRETEQKKKDIEEITSLSSDIVFFEEEVSLINKLFLVSGDYVNIVNGLTEKLEKAIEENHLFSLNKSSIDRDIKSLSEKNQKMNKQFKELESFYPGGLKGRRFQVIRNELEEIKDQSRIIEECDVLRDKLRRVFGEDIKKSFLGFDRKEEIEDGFIEIVKTISDERESLMKISEKLTELEIVREDSLQQDESILGKHQSLESKKLEMKILIDKYLETKISSRIIQKLNNQLGTKAAKDLIDRAGKYFEFITGGDYFELSIDEHSFFSRRRKNISVSNNGTISASHPEEEFVTVYDNQMSEGTKDQLFLSLRLAFVSMFNEKSDKKLPFIADDILINFDDERIENALKLFKEFSKTTQVFFFTHSSRVMEIWERIQNGNE